MQNLYKNVNPVFGLNATAISTDTTTAGTAIDTEGYETVLVIPFVTARSGGTVTPVIEDSDASGSGFAAVNAAQLSGTLADAAISAANTTKQVGVNQRKRYIKVSLVSTGSANLTAGALVILANPRHLPVA